MSEYNKVQLSFFANGDQVVLRADTGEELAEVAKSVAENANDTLKALNAAKQAMVASGVFTGDSVKKGDSGTKPRAADTPPPAPTTGPPPSDNGKVYLDVPFSEKDEAKAVGARWDKDAKRWYVAQRTDAVSKWL